MFNNEKNEFVIGVKTIFLHLFYYRIKKGVLNSARKILQIKINLKYINQLKQKSMKKIFTIFLMSVMFVGMVLAEKDLRILLVHDNNNTPGMTDSVRHAITTAGYSYVDYDAVTNGAPAVDLLSPYELVVWTTGKDGSTNFFDGELPNDGIKDYLDNGGMLWLEGIDFMYDGFGSAPDTFDVGDFCYDYLGVKIYAAQSHYDDSVYDGVPMMVVTDNNGICTIDTVTWRWSTMWGADAIVPTDSAKSIYNMGPADYDFAGKSCMVYNEKGDAKILSAFIRWDGFKTSDLKVSVTTEILDYFDKFSSGTSTPVASVTITSDSELTIVENNGSLQLGVTVLPDDATNKTVTWSIAEGSVQASISQDGLLTASGIDNGNGTVTVVATANDESGVQSEIEVTISNQTLGAGYKILLVNGDARDFTKYAAIENALIAGEYNYKLFDAAAKNEIPDLNYLSNFNFVLWYNGRDGVNLSFWDISDPANVQCNAPLKQFADNGGTVWVQARHMFYDVWGPNYTVNNAEGDSIIAAFVAGDFVYDYLGIDGYVAQAHLNETSGVYDGVQQMDITEENEITEMDPISPVYSSWHYNDVLDVADNAMPLYYLGPETYDFSLYYGMVYNKNGESEFITSAFDPSTMDTEDNINLLVKEVIDHFVDLHTSVDINRTNSFDLRVYPNPASDEVTLNFSFDKAESATIQIFDIAGRKMYNKLMSTGPGIYSEAINVSNMPNGFYSISVSTNNNRSIKRFIIAR